MKLFNNISLQSHIVYYYPQSVLAFTSLGQKIHGECSPRVLVSINLCCDGMHEHCTWVSFMRSRKVELGISSNLGNYVLSNQSFMNKGI